MPEAGVRVANSARQAGAAANLTAKSKTMKYDQSTRTHVFYVVAIETAGTRRPNWSRKLQNAPSLLLAIQTTRRTCFSSCP